MACLLPSQCYLVFLSPDLTLPDPGDYDLTISPVSLDDDAIYQCQAPPLASVSARLHVQVLLLLLLTALPQVPPSAPVLSLQDGHQDTILMVEEKKVAVLVCQSQGRPQADLQWTGARGRVLGQNSTAR